jgi:FtsH-binding integral membrane protein
MREDQLKLRLQTAPVVPERDLAFEMAVLGRIEQRRFQRQLLGLSLTALSLIVCVAALAPYLNTLINPVQPQEMSIFIVMISALPGFYALTRFMARFPARFAFSRKS